MGDRVLTFVLQRNRGNRLPSCLQHRGRGRGTKIRVINKCYARAPKSVRSPSGAGDARYSAAMVADQPAREADQDRRKVVSHGRYVTLQMAEVTVRDRCSPTFCPWSPVCGHHAGQREGLRRANATGEEG